MLAYVGAPRSLAELLVEPAHSLEVQSYAPKEMEEALLNADGFGVAWYTAGREEPARYRTILPMWADQNVRDFAGHVRSGHVLAAVRSATPGIGHGLANTQPFVHGPLTFLHNGFIRDFRRGAARRLRARWTMFQKLAASIQTKSGRKVATIFLLSRTRCGRT